MVEKNHKIKIKNKAKTKSQTKNVIGILAKNKKQEKNKMAYQITDACIKCGACIASCPVEAISMVNGKVTIDPAKCISCGTCAAVCPVGAPQAK